MIHNKLLYSLDFAWNSLIDFFTNQPFFLVIIITLIVRSFISKHFKRKLKQKYIIGYENEDNIENRKFYIDYYKKVQFIDIIGFFLIASLLFIYLLTKDKIVGSVLAVGIGAILITFQSFIVSFFAYFLLVSNYKIGDTIKIGKERIQGEILYIKTLYTGISGKNDFGENTGELHIVPNNYLRSSAITKTDLNIESYQKISFTIPYQKKDYPISFEEFITKLKNYLNILLPLRNATNVSYFKTYIGVKYKMDFEYTKDGVVMVRLGFIAKRHKASAIKAKIINFVEQLKDGI